MAPQIQEKLATLKRKLNSVLEGECDFSEAALALYTSDASNYRQVPLGIVYPRHVDDIKQVAALCKEHALPVLMRGGGTSQNGQCVNTAIVLDCSRYMTRILAIDEQARVAEIEPGVICDSLKAEAEKVGLTFGPDPATHSRCTLGGMIGNNSCGPHSMLAGKTVENVVELEILTSNGDCFWVGPTSEEELEKIVSGTDARSDIYRHLMHIRDTYADEIRQRYPDIKRRVSGYNLDQLLPENGFNVARALVGSEGTCVSVLRARVKLIENPKFKQLIVLGFNDIFDAGDAVPAILPFSPIAMEGLDWGIIGGLIDRNLKQREVALLPEGKAWLLTEIAASDSSSLAEKVTAFEQAMQASSKVTSVLTVSDLATVTDLWSIREQGASATSMSLNPEDPDPVVGWEDTAVDPMQLGDYLRELYALVERYGYQTSLYGHFGDGCIHARMTFDTRSEHGVKQWRQFSIEIAHLVVRFGGSLSGEHGDGQAKAEFLPIMFGESLMQAFREFKQCWDPEKRMNPGKLIDAYKMHENLRYGPAYQTPNISSQLHFLEDREGFGRATERCIGMGKCRAQAGAMCPSYQATQNERYSTRGRAHLLHEMARGEVITDGWDNTDVADSLEFCLSCKACKTECPTGVDMAAYKTEFMAAHFAHKRRPLHHYAFGQVTHLLPILSRMPSLSNTLQSGLIGQFAKRLLGVDQHKSLPRLAKQPFSRWAASSAHEQDEHFYWFGPTQPQRVVLWLDSVNNYYRPQLLQSAVNVLISAGFQVAVSRHHFCCGRPFHEYGFLEQAKKQLHDILTRFHANLPNNANIVVLEPSCLSVFRDDMQRFFPEDPRVKNCQQRTLTLAQCLSSVTLNINNTLPHGILHLHCHEKSTSSAHTERALMKQCFTRIEEPEAACCGMAGAFGMRKKTRHIAQLLFNRKLKPSIDQASSDTVLVSTGFSCQHQISDNTGRTVYHPVEILERCLH